VECLDECLSLVNNLAAPGFDSADYELISSASRQLYVSVSEASTQRFAELSLKVETYSLPFNSKTAADTIFVNRTGIAEARKKDERIVAKKRDYFMLVIEFQEDVANVCPSATYSQYAGTQKQQMVVPGGIKHMIRPMGMGDLATVYHLGNEIFKASKFTNLYRTWDSFDVISTFEGTPKLCFVAQNSKDDEIVGFLIGQTTTTSAGPRGLVEFVAVSSNYRRLGIARKLLEAFIEMANENSITLLGSHTLKENRPIVNLFNKVGFTHIAEHLYMYLRIPKDLPSENVSEDGAVNVGYTMANEERITIRHMTIDDLYPIYLIGKQIFSESPNLSNEWDEDAVLQCYHTDPELSIVATIQRGEKHVVVGFGFGTTIDKPNLSYKYGYILWLGCSQSHQKLGLGSKLYNVMLELFAKESCRTVMVDTQVSNEGALQFFRKKGFGQEEEHLYLSNMPIL